MPKIDLYGLPLWQKFAISIVYDVVDFFSVPVFGTMYDVVGIPLGLALWGPIGLINTWEVFDPLDATDRFVPTMTIAGLMSLGVK